MKRVDWNKAPEGATLVNPRNLVFYKWVGDSLYSYWGKHWKKVKPRENLMPLLVSREGVGLVLKLGDLVQAIGPKAMDGAGTVVGFITADDQRKAVVKFGEAYQVGDISSFKKLDAHREKMVESMVALFNGVQPSVREVCTVLYDNGYIRP